MQVGKDTVVTLDYQLYGTDGELIEKTDEPVEYLHGGYGNMFPAVEKALEGKASARRAASSLTPDDGFGDYDAELVHVEPRDKFPEKVEIGMQFEGKGEESGDTIVYTVTDIADEQSRRRRQSSPRRADAAHGMHRHQVCARRATRNCRTGTRTARTGTTTRPIQGSALKQTGTSFHVPPDALLPRLALKRARPLSVVTVT